MKKHKLNKGFIGLLIFIFLFGSIVPVGLTEPAAAEESTVTYSADELADKAVEFINGKFVSGEGIDGYTAYILTIAGEDLTSGQWIRDGKSLKREIQDLTDLVGDDVNLISYITATQNNDGSFGPYANMYGTRTALQALAVTRGDLEPESAAAIRVNDAITNAVNYFKALGYQDGELTYEAAGWDFDYRCVEALVAAGEDISEVGDWVYDGLSLGETVISSATAAAADSANLSAADLAKELSALYAAAPESAEVIADLADAIKGKAGTVSGQVYFGSSIYDNTVVLTALGRTGTLSGIDEEGALAYINSFKTVVNDYYGNSIGIAWGGWEPKEADLTAQILTALSFFDGAHDNESQVYPDIQGGLAYLRSVQDANTAAVKVQWDSTAATAEALIALKSLGEVYTGSESAWVLDSQTKTIAQLLLAVNAWDDTSRTDRLSGILAGRQKISEPGQGSFEDSVYSDMWAYIALGEAGKIADINTTDAVTYILSKQSTTEAVYGGSWGESFFGTYYEDVLSSIQAVRALGYFPEADTNPTVEEAVYNGLNYLIRVQQDDDSVFYVWDDAAVDTAELIVMLRETGCDPEGDHWTKTSGATRVNPVSYLLTGTFNEDDGSFGSSQNIGSAAAVLYGCIAMENADIVGTVENGLKYLNDQYLDDGTDENDTYLLEQYGGERASIALSLASQDIASGQWSRGGDTLADRIIAKAAGVTEADTVIDTAKALVSLSGMTGENAALQRSRLVGMIATKQLEDGNFSDGEIYNEMWPYLALTLADGWDMLAAEKRAAARDWLIDAQTEVDPDKGSWMHSFGVDTVSSAQAIYVLTHFPEANTEASATWQAVQDGLTWLKSKQLETGAINGSPGWDIPVVDTAEAVLAVLAAGGNPAGPEWIQDGNSLIDHLLLQECQNSDGSFGDKESYAGNVGSTVPALLALLEYNDSFSWVDFSTVNVAYDTGDNDDPTTPGGSNPGTTPEEEFEVEIAIVGKEGVQKPILGRDEVTVNEDSEYGLTVLGALDATGKEYDLGFIESGGKVESIEGELNSGMNGWMYKVNDRPGTGPAAYASVDEGDRIIWWYSDSMNSTGPEWEDIPLEDGTKANTQSDLDNAELSDDARETLDKIEETLGLKDGEELGPLGQAAIAVIVLDNDRTMAWGERKEIKTRLAGNVVDLSQTVSSSKDVTVTDSLNEIALEIPSGALDSNTKLTIQENSLSGDAEKVVPTGFRAVSSVYSFGPDGTVFDTPAILRIRVAIPPQVKPENLALAWYDTDKKQWVSIPAVYDAQNGVMAVRVEHFTDFAVFGREAARKFADVTADTYSWAYRSIETLAGAGIINGTSEKNFEPARSITRAELVALMARTLGLKQDVSEFAEFKDVPSNKWYAAEVTAAVQAGLIKGYGDGRFGPDDMITREQLAVIIANAMELEAEGAQLSFSDRDNVSSWAADGIAAAAGQGLVTGFPAGDFRPRGQATRAQCAVVIHRMLELNW
ncbi:S-layer homology domain-containing protein [Phosphitispora fastidiosa]|uniref:S-layer homology domain-containing protein n=1 Tax=Phosphitispora fastidiosa TaxID=2837202 RepID=UPI001E310ED4|nr:S-layer homology domain-containing protein [Phosphitispora fastidiosa]MBU7005857.1 prenyltransferase beta subunit [Phosphitispora fastidiosa]